MLSFLDSLGIGSGALVVMLISGVAALPSSKLAARPLRYIVSIASAFVIALMFYWLPVFLGADVSEFSGWSYIFVPAWFIAGSIAAVLTTRLLEVRSADRPTHS